MNISVIGAYLPRLSPERLAKYVAEDKWRYVNVGVPELRRQGFLKDVSDEYVRERAEEIAEETQYALERAALFELKVVGNDGTFDACSIEGAWEPVYLSPDGTVLLEETGVSVAAADVLRVAFYVHEWRDDRALLGPGRPRAVLKFSPVPERLWQLVPYSLVD